MFRTPGTAVGRAPHEIASLLCSIAVALTVVRFATARLSAQRDGRRPGG